MIRRQRRLATLLGLATIALLSRPGMASGAVPAGPEVAPARAVVIVAVPGLQWQDVRSGQMPVLAGLVRRGASGLLSVKVVDAVTRCGDGLLAVSAGSRTRGGARSCSVDPAAWPRLRAGNLSSSYRAHVGALGDALHRAGVRTAAVGAGAAPLLADAAGRVDRIDPDVATALGDARAVAVLAPQLYDARDASTLLRARREVDAAIGAVARQVTTGTVLLVAGTSDRAAGGPHLHVAVAVGPGFGPGALTSATTGRASYVELVDLAPTILHALDVRPPTAFIGTPMRATGTRPGRVEGFVDADRHAVQATGLRGPVGLAVLVLGVVVMLLFLWLPRRPGRAGLWLVAPAAAALPVATFLPQALPWWRAGPAAYVGLVAVGTVVVTTLAVATRSSRRAALVVLAVTAGALAVDQLAGAPLQLAAPLGDSPLVAGRFHGMGNIAFALFAASSLLLAALLAAGARSRWTAAVLAGLVGGAAVVVDGAPFLGDDVGGLLSLVPAVGVLVLLVSRLRVDRRRLLGLGAAAVMTALAVALADYARPAAHQTHMGRFVGSLLHGDGMVVVRRKLDSNLHQLVHGTFSVFLLLVVAFAIVAREPLRRRLRDVPGLPAGLWAVGVAAVVGGLANDSGVAVTAMVAAVAVPVTVLLVADPRREPSTTPAPAAPPLPPQPGQPPPLEAGQAREDPAASRG